MVNNKGANNANKNEKVNIATLELVKYAKRLNMKKMAEAIMTLEIAKEINSSWTLGLGEIPAIFKLKFPPIRNGSTKKSPFLILLKIVILKIPAMLMKKNANIKILNTPSENIELTLNALET